MIRGNLGQAESPHLTQPRPSEEKGPHSPVCSSATSGTRILMIAPAPTIGSEETGSATAATISCLGQRPCGPGLSVWTALGVGGRQALADPRRAVQLRGTEGQLRDKATACHGSKR